MKRMSEPRTKPRRKWWLATGLVICLVAAALRVGLPIYRRNCALGALRRLDFKVLTTSQKPDWLSRIDRWEWTDGFRSVDAVVNNFHGFRKPFPGPYLSRTETVELLSKVGIFGELKRLDFLSTAINDADLSVLDNFPNLKALNLRSTRITGDGLKYLAGSLNLQQLDLTGTQIDDAGLSHLVRLTNLENLHLDRTRISNAGLKHLAKLPNLRELSVSNTAVTDAGLDELIRFNPALSVSDD